MKKMVYLILLLFPLTFSMAEKKEFSFFSGGIEEKKSNNEQVQQKSGQQANKNVAEQPQEEEKPTEAELLPDGVKELPKYDYNAPKIEPKTDDSSKKNNELKSATEAIAEDYRDTNERKALFQKQIEILQMQQQIVDLKHDIWQKTKKMSGGTNNKIPQLENHNDSNELIDSLAGNTTTSSEGVVEERNPVQGIDIETIILAGTRSQVTLKINNEEIIAEIGDWVTDELKVSNITNKIVYFQDEDGKEYKVRFKKRR